MPLYEFEGMRPQIAEDAFIAPDATIIGNVVIGPQSSVWFNCTLRGDLQPIRVGARSNIQDNTVVHITAEGKPTFIGDDVTIGHAAIIHACRLEDGAFVGMGSTVLDDAVIEGGGMLAAHALLGPGKRIKKGELWAGVPAKLFRQVSDQDRGSYAVLSARYVEVGQRFRKGLKLI